MLRLNIIFNHVWSELEWKKLNVENWPVHFSSSLIQPFVPVRFATMRCHLLLLYGIPSSSVVVTIVEHPTWKHNQTISPVNQIIEIPNGNIIKLFPMLIQLSSLLKWQHIQSTSLFNPIVEHSTWQHNQITSLVTHAKYSNENVSKK